MKAHLAQPPRTTWRLAKGLSAVYRPTNETQTDPGGLGLAQVDPGRQRSVVNAGCICIWLTQHSVSGKTAPRSGGRGEGGGPAVLGLRKVFTVLCKVF